MKEAGVPRLVYVQLGVLSGEKLFDVVRSMNVTAGRLDGWGWRQLKTLPPSWFDGLARILRIVEDAGVWPDGLLDAYKAMIPKVDGARDFLWAAASVCASAGSSNVGLCKGGSVRALVQILGS